LFIVNVEIALQLVALEENCPLEELEDTKRHVVSETGEDADTVMTPETAPASMLCDPVEKEYDVSALAQSGSAHIRPIAINKKLLLFLAINGQHSLHFFL
jgi:hypothetical protein